MKCMHACYGMKFWGSYKTRNGTGTEPIGARADLNLPDFPTCMLIVTFLYDLL